MVDYNDAITNLINSGLDFLGTVGANGKFDIRRPTYTSATTAYTTLKTSQLMRIDKSSGSANAKPLISGAEYAVVHVNHTLILPGDILVPNPAANIAVPSWTVQNVEDKEDAVAFRTSRIGTLKASRGKTLFSNVAFDVFSGGVDSPLNPEIQGSQTGNALKAIMIRRAGINAGDYLEDTLTEERFDILAAAGTGMVMELILRSGIS